jgi:hypothetical protein
MKSNLLLRTFLFLFITGLLWCCDRNQWIPLYNGTNLEDWTVQCLPADKDKNYWHAVDGYIECNSMGDPDHDYVWLVSEREFSDFHLKLEFQLFRHSGGNSGIQFRSRYDDSDTARNGGWLNGPQADIHGPNPIRAGLIYDETDGVNRWIYPSLPDWNIEAGQAPESALLTRFVFHEDDPEAWNSMEIICKGMQVKTFVNGNLVTQYNGDGILNDEIHKLKRVGTKGMIALQLHSHDELEIRFRNLVVKEL